MSPRFRTATLLRNATSGNRSTVGSLSLLLSDWITTVIGEGIMIGFRRTLSFSEKTRENVGPGLYHANVEAW